jgi:phytoene dehydrogenase-like protein
VSRRVVVVGGGLAGLAASIYLARGGCSVTLFERRRDLGGRAMTTLRHGYRFNLGAHAFYRGGAGAAVYRELGIPIRGGLFRSPGLALLGDDHYRLPLGWLSLLTTSLLSFRGRREIGSALLSAWRHGGSHTNGVTLRQWLDDRCSDERARDVLAALFRLVTYADHPSTQSAESALAQMKVSLRGILYVDEGWQRIVDSLHGAAISAGVNFVTSSRIVSVEHDGAVRAIHVGGLELGSDRMDTQAIAWPAASTVENEGARVPADTVLLAVEPVTASELVPDAGAEWRNARPVTAACLDVALRSLPRRENVFGLGIDRPTYLSVHSTIAQVAPKGGALIHVAKYQQEQRATTDEIDGERTNRTAASAEEQELEALLDHLQPGWRDVLVHRRFLPAMTVSNALVTSVPRPAPVTSVQGLYLAGDWVGREGMLSDASLASARAAAKTILAS